MLKQFTPLAKTQQLYKRKSLLIIARGDLNSHAKPAEKSARKYNLALLPQALHYHGGGSGRDMYIM